MGMPPMGGEELVGLLTDTLTEGYDIVKISRKAHDIYHLNCLRLSPEMQSILFMLMAMEEGPEFELSELDYRALLKEIKVM